MINHDLFNTYEKWFELPVEPVYIHCLHPLRSMYHAACVEARSSGTNMIKVFQFSLTKQQFGAYAYQIEPGCIISDSTGCYECLAVTYGKMPKTPIVIARPVYSYSSDSIGKRVTLPTFLNKASHIRDRFILYREWFSLPLEKVNIESVVFKKGEHDFRWTKARSSGNDMFKFYQIEHTRRDFNAVKFPPEPGCVLRDDSGTYKCLSLFYPSKPAYPLFITQKIS